MSNFDTVLLNFWMNHSLLWFVDKTTGAFQAVTPEQAERLPRELRAKYIERLSLNDAITTSEQIKARIQTRN